MYAIYQIYMITNISQYVMEHLTDQPEDISLFAHPRVPEAYLKLKYDGQEPGLSYLPPRGLKQLRLVDIFGNIKINA